MDVLANQWAVLRFQVFGHTQQWVLPKDYAETFRAEGNSELLEFTIVLDMLQRRTKVHFRYRGVALTTIDGLNSKLYILFDPLPTVKDSALERFARVLTNASVARPITGDPPPAETIFRPL